MDVRLGVLTNYVYEPVVYSCAPKFLAAFLSCVNALSSQGHCFQATRGVCNFPGPGFLPELLAQLFFDDERALNVSIFEFDYEQTTSETTQQLVQNSTVDFWFKPDMVPETNPNDASRYTYPTYRCGYGFISANEAIYSTENPSLRNRLSAVFAPFTSPVWGFIVVATLLCAAFVAAAIQAEVVLAQIPPPRWKGIVLDSLWISFARFASGSFIDSIISYGKESCKSSVEKRWRSVSFLLLFWSFVSFLLQSLYSSTITGRLVMPRRMSAKFTRASELANLVLHDGYRLIDYDFIDAYVSWFDITNDSGVGDFIEAMKTHSIRELDLSKIADMLLSDHKLVLSADVITYGGMTFNRTLCGLLTFQEDNDLPASFCRFYVTPEKPWLNELLSAHLQKPVLSRLMRKYNLGARCSAIPLLDDFKPLALIDVSGVIFFLLMGICVCMCMLAFELYRLCRRVHKLE